MNDAALTQLGLTVLYTGAAALMALLERVEASRLFRTWSLAFLLFAMDSGLSAVAHVWELPPATHSINFVCLAGGAFMALRGGLEAMGRQLPRASYWFGVAFAVAVVSGTVLGVRQRIIELVVFAVIAASLSAGSVVAFRAGVPGGAGRWVLSTGGLAGALYAALWPIRPRLQFLERIEYQLDLTVLLWGCTGVLIMHFDRTRQRLRNLAAQELELREQLARAERLDALGRLAAGVAHDFNNVLAVVVSGSEVVLRQIDDRPKAAAQLRMVLDAAREASGFTRQLLSLGRRNLPGKKKQRLSDSIQAALRIIRPTLPANVALECSPVSETLSVLAADGQLEQLVVNLAINAADAMPDGGSLAIRVIAEVPSPREVRLVVTDTGIGMDDATRSRIFDPFFTTKTSTRGTGLGLTTVHGIVDTLGGRIAVTSNRDQGTAFTIDLPACTNSESDLAECPRSSVRSQVKVLLVDDDRQVARSLGEGLSALGYRTQWLTDPVLALDQPSAPAPDILVSDVRMPNLEGPTLATKLRERWPALPVLFMSGHTPAARPIEAAAWQVWLEKPFKLEELDVAIRALLERSKHSSTATVGSSGSEPTTTSPPVARAAQQTR